MGTELHTGWVELIKTVLEASSCHTLDRYNIRAWRDSCGNLPSEDVDKAVTALFSNAILEINFSIDINYYQYT